ncbi:MAG: efflux RND transporter periplasmic adaptor subunit [Verrucomicrobia bacterium]|nr:efflux RND transporter periplasmic adaptor subunit [Verrucomicrobiota bacterium]
MKRLLTLLALVFGAIALICAAAWQLQIPSERQRFNPSGGEPRGGPSPTTNAQPAGHITAEGRLVAYPGAQVMVSTEIGGLIQHMLVEEKAPVSKGQLIAEIKVDEQKAALAEAKARIAEIDAELSLDDLELKRSKSLLDQSVASRQEFDRAQRNYDVTTAQRQTALASVQRLEATVAKSEVRSPIDGVVLNRYAHPGEMAEIGTRLVTIADTNRVRIEAEVDEFDTGRVRVGQSVRITAEGYSGESWRGTVEETPDAVSEKNLKPQDPGRPTDARVLRAKIRFQEPTPLRLGQRVDVEIKE